MQCTSFNLQSVFLISDFQDQSFQIGLLKANVLRHIQDSQFIDVTHAIKLNNTIEAAFIGKTILAELPDNTVFIVAVGQNKTWTAYPFKGGLILTPNNGLLSMLLQDIDYKQVAVFDQSNLDSILKQWLKQASIQTQHPIDTLDIRYNKQPQFNDQICIAECCFIDGNGNCYFNLNADAFNHFTQQRAFSIKIQHYNGQVFSKIHKHVNDVVSGDALFRFDHLGHLMFQVNQGSAKQLFRIKDDTKIIIEIL